MTKSAKHTPAYPPEFRAEAVRLARTSGKPYTQIARELGMSLETLRHWLKQADLDAGNRHDGLTTEERRNYGACAKRTGSCGKSGRSW